jgi:uncharacterized protein YceK
MRDAIARMFSLVVLIILSGCGSRDLTRASAASLIATSSQFAPADAGTTP